MSVDLLCLSDGHTTKQEPGRQLTITYIPVTHRRGGKVSYIYQYLAFILISAVILAIRSLRRRYDLVHVHNMPDVLVAAALVPKAFGAKVILDLHDPMPELMSAVFSLREDSLSVRVMKRLEKWSIACAHRVITVNIACKEIVCARSCPRDKIAIVMNSPDEQLFRLRTPRPHPLSDCFPRQSFVIMYHGSLVERNGLDLAVAAVEKTRHTVPEAELRIYGRETPFLKRVMADVSRRGLDDCVRYFGFRRLEDLGREIAACDAGVIPNHRNAFTDINTPTRIFEYLARGKPVIAPRTRGILDYFGPESLFLFESGDVEELAGKLSFVALHPAEAAEAAVRGQQIYKQHRWSAERHVFVSLVRGLLQENRAQLQVR
jgi:glycosyltransferase involved in cell wall biosynthesis